MTDPRQRGAGDVLPVALYLVAIVAANLTITVLGPTASIVTAFFLIGLDLTLRDRLHDRWEGRQLWPRMLALIVTGGVISFGINGAAGPIAVASTVAFLAAGIVDAVVYTVLRDRDRLVRVNGSNVFSAAADSLIFPTLAFGGFLPLVVLGQFAAKVAGGFLWSLVLNRRRAPEPVAT